MRHQESEFLEFRQRIKESIREETQNGDSVSPTSEQRKGKLPYNDFGSFFGPSQPVIARRVILESKSLLENELAATKMLNSIQTKQSCGPTSASATKNAKRKAEMLKDSRDYSFLSSDDAELPVSIKEPPPRISPVPISRPSFWETQMDHSRPVSQPSSRLGSQRPVPSRKPDSKQMDHRKKPKPLTSDLKKQRVEQRKVPKELASSQTVPRKQSLASRVISKPVVKQHDHQLKKKRKSAKMSEDDELALRMIRKMCNTDRFSGSDFKDYDDRSMEANFQDIMKEEKRSEKLAKKEDAEQLRLIEEENRRERCFGSFILIVATNMDGVKVVILLMKESEAILEFEDRVIKQTSPETITHVRLLDWCEMELNSLFGHALKGIEYSCLVDLCAMTETKPCELI
ncbi:unnamed protein product [Thlaspi arvense]|uniref:Uncharacterized protein n=1 Tax=Thlaspi arvense TaxID=13288 RepID=A0AAU9T007_THLAR|nr:unnamed protein product [Thlaspi arvense]